MNKVQNLGDKTVRHSYDSFRSKTWKTQRKDKNHLSGREINSPV